MQIVRRQEIDSNTGLQKVVLNERELKRVSDYIGTEVGIQLPSSKHNLVESRLRKRLRVLGFDDFKTYLDHTLETTEGEREKIQLIDVITTNKTDFYRESEHFDYLVNTAIPNMMLNDMAGVRHEYNIWSAGCSTGEEAYTLSIELNEFALKHRSFLFNILATDISNSCLRKGSSGIYTERQISPIPLELRKKYLLRSSNKDDALVQMGTDIKRRILFKSLNLMDKKFAVSNKMDIIFCRNVMIYFDNKVREELVSKFENQLNNGGYLFVGHSESLSGIKTTLKQVSPMVYQKV